MAGHALGRTTPRRSVAVVVGCCLALTIVGCGKASSDKSSKGGKKRDDLVSADLSDNVQAFKDLADECGKKKLAEQFKTAFSALQASIPSMPKKTNVPKECSDPLKEFFTKWKDGLQKGCDATGDEDKEKKYKEEYLDLMDKFQLPEQKAFVDDFCNAGCVEAMEDSDKLKHYNGNLCVNMKSVQKEGSAKRREPDENDEKKKKNSKDGGGSDGNALIENSGAAERTPLNMPGADAQAKLDVPLAVAVDAVGQPAEPVEGHPTRHAYARDARRSD